MRLDRRTLVDSLERLGRTPVPPPSPDFAVRTEERLRSLRPVALVEDEPAELRPRRSVPWVPALAAAVMIALLAIAPRSDRGDVAVITDRSSTTTSTTITTPPTTAPAPATTTTTEPAPEEPVEPPPSAPVVTTAPKRALPTTTVATRPEPTTTAPVEPTIPPVTTTAPPPITKLELRCVAGTREGVPLVNCTWEGAGDLPVAGWRVYRAVGADAKRSVWTSSEATTSSYTDGDVIVGTIYKYAVEGFDSAGKTVAKTAIVEAACCPS